MSLTDFVPRFIRRRVIEANRHYFRTRNLEISFQFGFAAALCKFEDDDYPTGHWTIHLHPIWPNIYINVPFIRPRSLPADGPTESWGFCFTAPDGGIPDSIHLNWGDRFKILHMPWSWVHHRCDVLRADGSWAPERRRYADGDEDDGRHIETYPYAYRLESGEIQHRSATVYVDRREWRWRWFGWLGWPRKIRQSISVDFSDEVGERTGSWKGGAIGCGYGTKPGETAEQTLRRMEHERRFD